MICLGLLNCIGNTAKAILDRMDRCAIRINRYSPCVRKTSAVAVCVMLPMVAFFGAVAIYANKVPKNAFLPVFLFGTVLPVTITIACLMNRYSWLLRPSNLDRLPPPESILARLYAESANPELPLDHRKEAGVLVQHYDEIVELNSAEEKVPNLEEPEE